MVISKADFDYVRALVEFESAIVLGPEKRYLVETRLEMLARTLHMPETTLLERLRNAAFPEVREKVVEAMTTNETWFFRDQHPFETLRTHVFPRLIESRAQVRRLNIWSAASSTGQEPYSIAILLREHFPELRNWSINLLATDINRSVLERAESGRFTEVELGRGMPATLIQRYFQRQGDMWVLDPGIRSMVTYRLLNLKDSWPPLPAMDLVLLRNVLIYFSPDTKRQILTRIRSIMRPDGYLLLGSSETTHFLDETFQSVHLGSSICYQIPEPASQAA